MFLEHALSVANLTRAEKSRIQARVCFWTALHLEAGGAGLLSRGVGTRPSGGQLLRTHWCLATASGFSPKPWTSASLLGCPSNGRTFPLVPSLSCRG